MSGSRPPIAPASGNDGLTRTARKNRNRQNRKKSNQGREQVADTQVPPTTQPTIDVLQPITTQPTMENQATSETVQEVAQAIETHQIETNMGDSEPDASDKPVLVDEPGGSGHRHVTPPWDIEKEVTQGSSKRPISTLATPDSPEHKRLPQRKRSKLNLNDKILQQAGKGVRKKLAVHHGKRGGRAHKDFLRDEKRRHEEAIRLIQTLDMLGKPIHGSKDINKLTNDEAFDIAAGHRLTMKDGDHVYCFDIGKEGERWRKKHKIQRGQFKDKVMTTRDIEQHHFRVFKDGAVYAYEKNKDGKEELVFSATFTPYSKMDSDEYDDLEYCGEFFAMLREEGGPWLHDNAAHSKEGSGGNMLGLGWRGASEADFRGGFYARKNKKGKKWKDYWNNQCRVAAYYSRKFLKQAPRLHGFNNEFVRKHRLPKLDEKELGLSDGTAPACNLTVTCDDFCNGIHTDNDASKYTFGLWFTTDTKGQLIEDPGKVRKATTGGYFVLPDYGIAIDFGGCAGVVALTWRGPTDLHGTTKSTTNPGYVRWGTSIQCAERMVERVDLQRKALMDKIDRKPESKKGKVKVLKFNDYYERTGEQRPEHPNPNWYKDFEESWDIAEEPEVEEVEVQVYDVAN